MTDRYSHAEVAALLAPVMGLPPEDIDDFVIIVKGLCPDCGRRDGYTQISSEMDYEEFVDLISGGTSARIFSATETH